MTVPVVVGAFPEPFLHGFESVKPGPTSVVAVAAPRNLAVRLARRVHGVVAAKATARNVIVVSGRLPPAAVRIRKSRNGVLLELGDAIARTARRRPVGAPLRLPGCEMSAAPAAALLAAVVVAALARRSTRCGRRDLRGVARRRAGARPAKRRWPYLVGTLTSAALRLPAHARSSR